jgi:tetratricopeptide (TPR) repeat protein
VVLVLCAAFVVHAHALRFTQDDAYISFRYAKNLVEGHGLVFNPGERVEGYSNFSWTLLMALVLRAGLLPPETAATWIGIACAVGAILCAARLARALEGRWGTASVLAAALVAGTSAFAMWCTGGLETALFTFLVTAALERGLSPGAGSRAGAAAAALFSLATLTRPEAPLLFALWFAPRVLGTLARSGAVPSAAGAAADAAGPGPDAAGPRALLREALIFALPLVPYAAWKLWYFGDLLPNTFYAKAGTSREYLERGLAYAREYFGAYGLYGAAPALAVLAAARAGLRSAETRLLIVWLGFAAYVITVGGDVLHVHRFWLPVLPAGCVLAARGADACGRWLARRAGRPRAAVPAAAAVAAAMIGVGLARNWDPIQLRREAEIGFVRNMAETGSWLARSFPEGAKIAITTIGAVSYTSGLVVIDMLGLTDRTVARDPRRLEGLDDTWREINYNAESVLARRPDLILFSTGVRPSAAAEKALFLYRDFYRSYYAYYFRATPNRANSQVGFRLRPGAPPFSPELLDVPGFAFLDEYGEGHLVQSRHHDYTAAAEHFLKSWELSGGRFPAAREWLATARYDGGLGGAIDELREIARTDSFSVTALARVGDHALRTDDPDTAARAFERITEIDPDDAVGWMGRAETARVRGDYEEGLRHAAEGVRRWDTSPANLCLFGELALRTGRIEHAENALRRALAFDPDFAPAREYLAFLDALRRGEVPGSSPAPGMPIHDGEAEAGRAGG